jgi:predicted anti-sigma-YlaC factor YlaD
MDCGRFRTLYSEFADGLLDELTEVRCHRHLAECEPCRRLHTAYRAGCSMLRREPQLTPSPDFAARLDARLGIPDRPFADASPARQLVVLAGAVTAVVVIAASGWTMVDSWPAAPVGIAGPATGRAANPFVVRFDGDTSLDYPGHFPIIPVSRTRLPTRSPAQFEITVDWMEP